MIYKQKGARNGLFLVVTLTLTLILCLPNGAADGNLNMTYWSYVPGGACVGSCLGTTATINTEDRVSVHFNHTPNVPDWQGMWITRNQSLFNVSVNITFQINESLSHNDNGRWFLFSFAPLYQIFPTYTSISNTCNYACGFDENKAFSESYYVAKVQKSTTGDITVPFNVTIKYYANNHSLCGEISPSSVAGYSNTLMQCVNLNYTTPFYIGATVGMDGAAGTSIMDYNMTFNYPSFTPQNIPWITIHNPTPVNNDRVNSQVTANFSCSQDATLEIWFYNRTGTPAKVRSATLSTNLNYTSSMVNEGNYTILFNCSNMNGTSLESRNITYDVTSPILTVNPRNFVNMSNQSTITDYQSYTNGTINITITSNISDIYAFEIHINHSNGTLYFNYSIEGLSGWRQNITREFNFSTYPRNVNYTVSLTAADSHTRNQIGDYQVTKKKSSITFKTQTDNNIKIETDMPSTIDATKLIDRYTYTVSFDDGQALPRTFHVKTDLCPLTYLPNSRYKAHFVSYCAAQKDGNWIDFEGIDGAPTVTRIDDYHYTVYFSSVPPTFTSRSVGGMNYARMTLRWYLPNYPIVYSATLRTTYSTYATVISEDTLYGYCNHTSSSNNVSIESKVYLNTSINFSISDYYYSPNTTMTANITPLLVVGSSYTYSCRVYDPTIEVYSSWRNSTAVSPAQLSLTKCSSGNYSAVFYSRDEDYPNNPMNATLEIDGTYYANSVVTRTLNATYDLNTTFYICIYPFSANVTADFWLKYVNPLSYTHHYYLINEQLTNTTKTFYMYNLNNTVGHNVLKIILRSAFSYDYMTAVYAKLQRRYPAESAWRTVQMQKVGDFGIVNFDIYERTQQYRVIYVDSDNTVLKTTEISSYICPSVTTYCEYTELIGGSTISSSNDSLIMGFSYSNTTKVLTIQWLKPSGTEVTVRQYATIESGIGATTISDRSNTSASGTSTLNLSGYTGIVRFELYEDGTLKAVKYVEISSSRMSDHLSKTEAGFWTFGIMLTLIMVGLFLGTIGVIVSCVFGVILLFFVGIFSPLTITFMAVIIIMAIVISVKLRQ